MSAAVQPIDLEEGFRVTYGPHRAEYSIWHAHEFAYFTVLEQGQCRERIESLGERDLQPWTVSFHKSDEMHARRAGPQSYYVFGVAVWDRALVRLEGAASKLVTADLTTPDMPALARKLAHEFRRQDAFSPLCLSGILLEILGATGRQQSGEERSMPRWLREARDHLHEADTTGSLTALADQVAVSPSHLAREFRKQFGKSVGEYAREVRLQRAYAEVLYTDRPLAQLAAAYGFADESHFVRSFRRLFQITPGRLRNP